MRWFSADEVRALGDIPGLVQALDEMNRRGTDRVELLLLSQPVGAGRNDFLILPAWTFDSALGVKIANVFPGNAAKGLATVQGAYLLFDGETGETLCGMDGPMLTLRKTAANSALASQYLARGDAKTLAMLGAGALAPHLVEAHCRTRPIRRVLWWSRREEQAAAAIKTLSGEFPQIAFKIATSLQGAIEQADIVSAATASTAPLVRGEWLKSGAHLDLVGGYRPDMREADDNAAHRAARLYVDARLTTIGEVGDVIGPIESGIVAEASIIDLGQVARGEAPSRLTPDEITWFKSGGGGHEDLASARYIFGRAQG